MQSRRLPLLLATTLLGIPSAGWAQEAAPPPAPEVSASERETLTTIVVTAQRRQEDSQKVPVAIDVLGSEELAEIGFTNITDITQRIPALKIQPFNYSSAVLDLRMRGVGSLNTISTSNDPAVGIYVDDVYIARSAGLTMDLLDVERLEVLRGPQGTLYGRNTTGGAVKFVSAAPTGEFGVTESLDFGNYDYWRTLTSVNLPKFKDISVKLTYLRSDFGGWVENSGAGGNYGQRDREGFRAAIRWQPTDSLTADYAYDRGTQDGTANFFTSSLTRPDRSPPIDTPNRDDFRDTGHALTLAWDVSEHAVLKSVTSYRELKSDALTDTAGAFFGVPIIGNFSMDQHQFSEELLLSGDAPGLSLKYTAGALYFSESGRNLFGVNVFGFQTDLLGPETPGRARNKSTGIYADVTWIPPALENRLDLTVGGRFSFDDREASGGVVLYGSDSADSDSFDPSVTLDYHFSNDVHAYAKYARAYRTGGFSQFDQQLFEFSPEHVAAYEIGLKAEGFGDRARFNINAFYEDYSDIQVATIVVVPSCPFGCAGTQNGGNAEFTGVEGELELLPLAGLRLRGDYAYLDTDGEILFPNAPRWSYNADVEYSFAPFRFGALSAVVNYSYNGRQISSTTADIPFFNEDSRLLNARLTLARIPFGSGQASISLWGNNLTDEEYTVYANSGALIYGTPRTYGVNLSFQL